MIKDVALLMRWEWFKLRQRWMPWILLGILVLFSQLVVWGAYFTYTNLQATGGQVTLPGAGPRGRFQLISCNALRDDPSAAVPAATAPEVIATLVAQCNEQAPLLQARLQGQFDTFTLPGSLSSIASIAGNLGLILSAILAASVIGSEYGLGTLRPLLARGVGRVPYLLSKLLLLVLAAAGALLILSLVTAASSLIAAAVAQPPPAGPAVVPTWAAAATDQLKIWFSFFPFIALTALLAILTRSVAAAMGISLGYFFMEGILVSLLSAFIDGFDAVADYLLIRSINAFTGGGFAMLNAAEVDARQAGLHLLLYTLVLAGTALALFRRHDVTGPSGG